MQNVAVPEDIRGKCTALLQLYDSSHSEWQLGKTKVKPQRRNVAPPLPQPQAPCPMVLLAPCFCFFALEKYGWDHAQLNLLSSKQKEVLDFSGILFFLGHTLKHWAPSVSVFVFSQAASKPLLLGSSVPGMC